MTTVFSAAASSFGRTRETSRARIAPLTPTIDGPPPVSPLSRLPLRSAIASSG
jgi:hypothetical protein